MFLFINDFEWLQRRDALCEFILRYIYTHIFCQRKINQDFVPFLTMCSSFPVWQRWLGIKYSLSHFHSHLIANRSCVLKPEQNKWIQITHDTTYSHLFRRIRGGVRKTENGGDYKEMTAQKWGQGNWLD